MSENGYRLSLPEEQDFWVFGYGSLLWNPGFPHVEVQPARVRGYHRRLCVYSVFYRGTYDVPGLVFGLDRGGSCWGLAYRVPSAEGEAVMDYLYERELVTTVYVPAWVKVETEHGNRRAATFVVDSAHERYAGRLDEAEMAAIVARGRGNTGTNSEYLANTVRHLEALGLGDRALRRLLRRVETTAPQAHLE